MKTVILCGGQGTRIRDVADDIPKPMIPIGGKPILWHIMKSYAVTGYENFILCTGYQGNVIKEFFLNYEAFIKDFTISLGSDRTIETHGNHDEINWRVTLADTGVSTMTGARVKRIQKYIGDDKNFMLTYGDGVSDVDIEALVDYHKSHGKILTITGVRPPARFGEMETDADGKVREFNEKPQAGGGRISGGYFVCRREIFDYLDDREDLVLEQGPMRKLALDDEMMVYHHDGFWQCMDTARDHKLVSELWRSGDAPWKRW
jgi:glucose-1-phosphate cytidylyltransferase